jgi:hypothetical protein
VSRLAGQAVRLRFVMKDADLYSFKFQKDDTTLPNKTDASAGT